MAWRKREVKVVEFEMHFALSMPLQNVPNNLSLCLLSKLLLFHYETRQFAAELLT